MKSLRITSLLVLASSILLLSGCTSDYSYYTVIYTTCDGVVAGLGYAGYKPPFYIVREGKEVYETPSLGIANSEVSDVPNVCDFSYTRLELTE